MFRNLAGPASKCPRASTVVRRHLQTRTASTNAEPSQQQAPDSGAGAKDIKTDQKLNDVKETKKTVAQLDEEMRQAMEGVSGGGGDAGIELEDGKPVAMKRSVKENMFRLI